MVVRFGESGDMRTLVGHEGHGCMQGVSAGSAWEVQLWKGEGDRAGRSWSTQLGRLCVIPHTVTVTHL